jgi:hypothetical protein
VDPCAELRLLCDEQDRQIQALDDAYDRFSDAIVALLGSWRRGKRPGRVGDVQLSLCADELAAVLDAQTAPRPMSVRRHAVERLREVLRALADDYEAMCGGGMTEETQPAVLREARRLLAQESK